MKKTGIFICILLFGLNVFAQDKGDEREYKTLFGGEHITHGGYGALTVNYTQVDGVDAVLVGVKGAWIINHGIGIGIAGSGFANDMEFEKTLGGNTKDYLLVGGYGGLLIEPIIGSFKPVHLAIPVIIGAGGATYIDDFWNPFNDPDFHEYNRIDSDAFFVIEPGIEIELNMVKFMRLSIGGYYRYTSGLNLENTDNELLNGFSAGIALKFGKF